MTEKQITYDGIVVGDRSVGQNLVDELGRERGKGSEIAWKIKGT